jgi:hypothetical protein
MTDANMDRVTCPDCGKPDILVNRDGSLRKHPCVTPEVVTDTTTTPVDDGSQVRAELASKPDVFTQEPAAPPRMVKDPRLCRLPGCDRPKVIGELCGAHWATRRDYARRT